MGPINDRNGMDLTEAEDIKKRWQEYTEELYQKDLHDQDNHDDVITEEGFLISYLGRLAILWNSAFRWVYLSFSPLPFTSLFSAISKASSDNRFAFLHFFFLGIVLITASVQCHEPPSIVLQAFCLSDLIP